MKGRLLVLVGMMFVVLALGACTPASESVPAEDPALVDPSPPEEEDVMAAETADAGSETPLPIEPEVLPLITQTGSAGGAEEALLSGTLEFDERGCWRVASAAGSYLIVWPQGFTATALIGAPQVLDASGEVVGTTGMEISLGGGAREGDAASAFEEEHPDLPSEQCPGPYWIVGQVGQ